MGMYTEIVIKARVKDDIPQEVVDVLDFLFNCGDEPHNIPKHEFFNCSRWKFIGRCSSYYHIPWPMGKYEKGYVFSRSDLKNYDDEIYLFFDWFRQYCEGTSETCIGYSWYEEDASPTLVYLGGQQ